MAKEILEEANFEEYLKEITNALNKLDDENLSLSESMQHYAKGMEKLKKAQEMLENAKIQCTEIQRQFNKEKE